MRKVFTLVILLIFVGACNHNDSSDADTLETGDSSSLDAGNTSVEKTERILDITSADTEIITIDRYFSLYDYGDTLRFYHFRDQNAVLTIRLPIHATPADLSGTVTIFASGETPGTIARWINNQHSDGLSIGAPEPVYSTNLTEAQYSILSATPIDLITGGDGHLYNNMRIEFFINNTSEAGAFSLSSFTDDAVVHYRSYEPLPTDEPLPVDLNVLDVSADNVEIINLGDTTNTDYVSYSVNDARYKVTHQLYYFSGQDALLHLQFPNSDTNFEVYGSIHYFDGNTTQDTIIDWITDLVTINYVGPTPSLTIQLTPEQVAVTYSEYVDSAEITGSEKYDNYLVGFTVSNVEQWYATSLKGFSSAVVVHVPIYEDYSGEKLDVASENTEVTTIEHFSGSIRYRSTLRFYHFTQQNTVLMIHFPNTDAAFEMEATVNIFAENETAENITKWINSQNLYGLVTDAPQPVSVSRVGRDRYVIDNSELIDYTSITLPEMADNESIGYQNYRVEFSLAGYIGNGSFELTNFSDEVMVHLETFWHGDRGGR